MMQSLDELAREDARRMIVVALELEVDECVSKLRQLRDEDGHALVVRNGHAQERTVTLGAGPVKVSAPRVNDRRDKQRFSSRILPPFTLVALAHDSVLRDATFAAAAPSRVPRERGRQSRGHASTTSSRRGWTWYLRGLSTGDFAEALPVLLGPDAAGLSPTTITRLTQVWQDEYQAWRKRSLAGTDYVYIWADGVYFNVRLEEDRLACLAVMGGRACCATCAAAGCPHPCLPSGTVPWDSGPRCGMCIPRRASNAAGFIHLSWRTVPGRLRTCSTSWPSGCSRARRPRCTRSPRHCPRASVRTTNPIESSFTTVKVRTRKTKGAGSRKAGLAMAFKLVLAAEKR